MQAVVIDDGNLMWTERPDPVPGDTELLVAVEAAGLNGADMLQRLGLYPVPPGWPADIPGMEFAGEVVRVGKNVSRHKAGDRVMAVVGGGAQATLARVDEVHAMPVPAGLAWPEAGGFPEVFSTAYDGLFDQGQLTMGERVLVSGSAGGVGTAAVQMAAAAGAEVVATVRSPDRRDDVAALGATHVVDPSAVAAYGPYDVVLELVGAESLDAVFPHLAVGARVVVIGVGSGATISLNLFSLMATRSRLSGSTLRSRSLEEKAVLAGAMAKHVLPLLESGRLTVPVCATVPMAEAESAYARFEAGSKLGKVVLIPGA
jgi:NADPH2:quinone reductase